MAPRTLTQASDEARVNRAKLATTTAEDIERHAREDETNIALRGPVYPSPSTVRRELRMTQREIASLAGVPLATWQNWEQGRVSIDPAVRTLLRLLWREPAAVKRAMDMEAA